MKTFIIFDTNVLFLRNYNSYATFEFNKIYEDIQGKIERHDVTEKFELLVPEVTLSELFQKQLQSYDEEYKKINKIYTMFDGLYEIELNVDETFDYESFLNNKKNEYLLRKQIKILPICGESRFTKIVARALGKKAPFEGIDKQSDKGFKDALIWESILEFAEKNDGNFLLFTGDKRFKGELEEEFEQLIGNTIIIYNKDETRQLDSYIEEYSSEKTLKLRLNEVKNNLEFILKDFLEDIRVKMNADISVNGIKVTVTSLDLFTDIINLNESGDTSYKFKLKGKLIAEQPGIHYELLITLDFQVEVLSIDDTNISSIKLENIEAITSIGVPVGIENIEYEYLPLKNYDWDDFEEESNFEEESEFEKTRVKGDVPKLEKKDEVNIYFDEEFKLIYDVLNTIKSELSDHKVHVLATEIALAIKNNMGTDWMEREPIRAKMRVDARKLLKKHEFSNEKSDIIVDEIIKKVELMTREKSYV
ncbi:PIN domain-containing protein [Fictibacillus sp. B-59209]|uniref:PIN domain-containing protein n=1 Tax=Fictibacillus sp. B-59209 TaxID=3024873 RepID=UPI002E210EAB|nr:PIN domain-containing protein [Fictibacillus sp. B-59209]